jgi:hypothetical protein
VDAKLGGLARRDSVYEAVAEYQNTVADDSEERLPQL